MKNFSIKNLPVSKYSLHPDIMSLQLRTEGKEKWYVINYDTQYNASEWTITDAIAYYLSEESRLERDLSFRRAWGFYD